MTNGINITIPSKLRKHWLALVIFLIMGFLPITWASTDEIIVWGSQYIPTKVHFESDRYTWRENSFDIDNSNFGSDFTNTISESFPLYWINSLFDDLGLSIPIIQKIDLYIAFALAGLSMYILVQELLPEHRITGILAGAIYTLNWIPLMFIWMPNYGGGNFTYSLVPLTTALAIKTVRTKNWVYFALTQAFFLFHNLNVQHPFWLITIWLYPFSLVYFLVLKGEIRFKTATKWLFALVFFWILLNAWWFIPRVYKLPSTYDWRLALNNTVISADTIFYGAHIHASLLNNFRILGNSQLFDFPAPWGNDFRTQPFLILISFLLPIWAIVSAILKRKSNSDIILYFFIVWVLCLFLSKGPHDPLGNITSWLMENVPGFTIFRHSNEKFGYWMVWSLAILAGYGVERASTFFRNKWGQSIFVSLMIIGMAGVNVWPAWTGDLIHSIQTRSMPFFARIPASYYKAAQLLNEEVGKSYAYILPRSGTWPHEVYSWGYASIELLSQLTRRSTVVAVVSPQNVPFDIGGIVYDALRNGYPFPGRLLGALNVGNVVVHKDIDPNYTLEPPSLFVDQFDQQEDLSKIYDSPELNIYEVHNLIPQIFAVRNILYSVGNFKNIPAVISLDNYDQTKAVLFTRLYGIDTQVAYVDDFPAFSTKSFTPDNVVVNAQPTQDLHVYDLSVPYAQTYELMIQAATTEPLTLRSPLPITIGDQTFLAKPDTVSSLPGGWYKLGVLKLEKGTYQIRNDFTQNPVHILLRYQNQDLLDPPNISFVRINPTKYIVHVQNSSSPFLLSFLQSFDNDWRITRSDGTNTEIPHFQVNGYANGWWVTDAGTYDLTIEYFPQKLFNLGLVISLITLVLGLSILFRNVREKKMIVVPLKTSQS